MNRRRGRDSSAQRKNKKRRKREKSKDKADEMGGQYKDQEKVEMEREREHLVIRIPHPGVAMVITQCNGQKRLKGYQCLDYPPSPSMM